VAIVCTPASQRDFHPLHFDATGVASGVALDVEVGFLRVFAISPTPAGCGGGRRRWWWWWTWR